MDLREQFIQVFRFLDRDKDDCLSAVEVDQGVLNPRLTSTQAAVVAVLKTEFSQITGLHKDGPFALQSGISLKDLVKLIAILNAKDSESTGDTTAAKFQERTFELMKRVDTLSTKRVSLYDKNNLASDSIRPEAVAQGRIGNCSFMAALASLAAVSPKTIENSITDNLNETYTVTFRGAPATPFIVAKPTLVERSIYARDSQFGYWPAVMEKAYGCYRRSTSFDPKLIDAENTSGSQYWSEIFALITGQHARLVDVKKEQSNLQAVFDEAFKECRALCAWSGDSAGPVTRDAAIPTCHVFSVLSWSSEKRLLTLYNPWGAVHGAEPLDARGEVADGKLDGFFHVTLDQFCTNFDHLHVEEWSNGTTLIQEQAPAEIAKNQESLRLANLIRLPITVAVLCLALVTGACIIEQSRIQMSALSWPQTTATIYIPGQTLCAPTNPDTFRPYFKEFEYNYRVNGKTYQGRDTASLADLVYENDALANAHRDQTITVSYNPQNPAESRLRPGLHFVAFCTMFVTGVMAVAVALMSLLMLLISLVGQPERKRKDHNNLAADHLIFAPIMQKWVPTKWRAKILHVLKVVY